MDEQKIQQFKQAALSSGYQPEEVDSFISQMGNQISDQVTTSGYDPTGKTFNQVMAETGNQSTLDAMNRGEFQGMPSPAPRSFNQNIPTQPQSMSMSKDVPMDSVPASPTFSSPGPIPEVTQAFGDRSSIEKYSGGVNLGADFRVQSNTPLLSPSSGNWVVEDAKPGFNQGSGNLVTIRNTNTGESITTEHLSSILVRPGQRLQPGQAMGLSGGSQGGAGRGNSTGAHASIVYKNGLGEYRDILSTPYASDVFGQESNR